MMSGWGSPKKLPRPAVTITISGRTASRKPGELERPAPVMGGLEDLGPHARAPLDDGRLGGGADIAGKQEGLRAQGKLEDEGLIVGDFLPGGGVRLRMQRFDADRPLAAAEPAAHGFPDDGRPEAVHQVLVGGVSGGATPSQNSTTRKLRTTDFSPLRWSGWAWVRTT